MGIEVDLSAPVKVFPQKFFGARRERLSPFMTGTYDRKKNEPTP